MQMPHVNMQTAYNTLLDVPPPHTRHAISYDAFVVTVSYSNSPWGPWIWLEGKYLSPAERLCRLMCTKKKSLARTQYHTSRGQSDFPWGNFLHCPGLSQR